MLDWIESKTAIAGTARKVRREEADADHGQRQAERIIRQMLEMLNVAAAEIVAARKGDWRKRVIAQGVRKETSVSLRWLSGRLQMGSEGHASRVSRTWMILRVTRDGAHSANLSNLQEKKD